MLLYPRRWRQRYGIEVETLIDDTGGGWRVVADVARQALPDADARSLAAPFNRRSNKTG